MRASLRCLRVTETLDIPPEPAGAANAEDLVRGSLEHLFGQEGRLAELAFARFFRGHPEIEGLFGRESLSEQEEMVRESLASALAHVDGEPWLQANLAAMGASHREYGVREEMYDRWVTSLLAALSEVLGARWDDATARSWRTVLEAISEPMVAAGRVAP